MQRDMAMWRPWNSSMKRNALWMSKIRWNKCLLFISLHASHIQTYTNTLMSTNTHVRTTTHQSQLSLSNYCNNPAPPIEPLEKHCFESPKCHTHMHTNSHVHTCQSEHLGRKPVTLTFYQLICCCYRNRSCWGRFCVCARLCVFVFDAGVASITELAWAAEIPKAFTNLLHHLTHWCCPLLAVLLHQTRANLHSRHFSSLLSSSCPKIIKVSSHFITL